MFPNDTNYRARVLSATFGPSASSGNPMITLEYEFYFPEEIEVAGKQYNISGVKCKKYHVTSMKDDAEKTESMRAELKEKLFSRFEIAEINWDNIDTTKFLGKAVLVHANSEAEEQRKDPTVAQIAEAKAKNTRPQGDVLKHPVTGQDMIFYRPSIREVFALAPTGSAQATY